MRKYPFISIYLHMYKISKLKYRKKNTERKHNA